MKIKFVLFLQVLMLAFFILFLNCQQVADNDSGKDSIKVIHDEIHDDAWVIVTDTSVQAIPNKCYIADSSSLVTVNMPLSSSLTNGDIIGVCGKGSGGWKITQNDGQRIFLPNSLAYNVWTPRESIRGWISITSSFDGTKLAAVVSGGQVYTSTDSGATWTPRESSRGWWSITSSSDGTKLAAVVGNGQIYTSTATTIPGAAGSVSGNQADSIILQYNGNGNFIILSSYVEALFFNKDFFLLYTQIKSDSTMQGYLCLS